MARTKISEFSATAADNTDIDNIDIAEGCAPSGINNAIRELMAQLKDFQTGAAGDPFNGAVNGTLGATTPAAATITNLAYTGTLTGGTGVINIGSGQVYKDASGNVGIGTSSPVTRLQLGGAADKTIRIDTALSNAAFYAGWQDTAQIGVNRNPATGTFADAGKAAAAIRLSASNANSFITLETTASNSAAPTERMRLDSSGNLGLGVTPSAWASYKAFQSKNSALIGFDANETAVTHNSFWDGSWKYIGSGPANRYEMFYGAHRWFTAPSGTAGNAISFTQAMTLNASGNLGIGTTTIDRRVDARAVSDSELGIYRAAVLNTSGTVITYVDIGANTANNTCFIEATGTNSASLLFRTGGNEYARINTVGEILLNCTGQTNDAPNTAGGTIKQPNGNTKVRVSVDSNPAFQFYSPTGGTSAAVGSVTVGASGVSYNTTSDYRLKENVAPMTGALAKITELKPCTYTWKLSGLAGQGFLAHELQAVVPDCVTGEKDAVDSEGNPKYQGVDTSFLVATLVAAIQELTAKVEALEAAAA